MYEKYLTDHAHTFICGGLYGVMEAVCKGAKNYNGITIGVLPGLDKKDANKLVKNGDVVVAEAANMPSTPGAIEIFIKSRILFAPGKAVNAGGVAVSGLEMSQNSIRSIIPALGTYYPRQ